MIYAILIYDVRLTNHLTMKTVALFLALLLMPIQAFAMSQPLFSAIGQISGVSGSTRYYGCGNSGVTNSSIALVAPPLSVAGVLDNLQVSTSAAPGAGTTITYTVEKNDVDTTQTCQISDTATTCSDAAHPITFAAGDTCGIRTQATTGAPAAIESNVSNSFVPTADGEAVITGSGSSALNSATGYYAVYGDTATTSITRASTTFPTNGTVDKFYVALSGTPGTGTSYDFTVFKNGVTTGITCQVANTATTCNDPTNTASFSAGDSITIQVVPTGTPTARSPKWGLRFTPTINGESVLFVRELNNSNVTRYHAIQGSGERSTNEVNVQVVAPLAFQLKKLYFNIVHGQPTAGTSRILTVRKNGAGTSLGGTLTDTAAWVTDLSDTVDYAAGDLVSTEMTNTGSPPTAVVEFWSTVAFVDPGTAATTPTSKFRIFGGKWNIFGGSVFLR